MKRLYAKPNLGAKLRNKMRIPQFLCMNFVAFFEFLNF